MNQTIPNQTAWTTQKNVVFALFTRELKARFSHFRLGYIWAIGEPLAMVAILSAVRMAFGKQDIAGVPYPLFFATGLIPYYFFQTNISQSLNVIENNMALMNYRVVKPADPMVAKCILELIIYCGTGVIIVGGMVTLGFKFEWNDTFGVVSVMACLIAFTLGLGLITAVVGAFIHESKKIVPILVRPFFFISGIFFPAESIPVDYREILLWNPLLHVSELIREYIFSDFQSPHGDLAYLFICSIISLFLGLYTYSMNRIRLSTSGLIR
jgi:capsular polysaccharide transport system permease protein